MLDINIIINIFINWLMTQTKNPMTHIWVMTYRLGTTALKGGQLTRFDVSRSLHYIIMNITY